MDHANQYLGTERTGTLMKRYAVPCIISLLVGALYNQRQLPGLIWKRGQYGCLSPYRGRAGHRGHDRRRLLRHCQYQFRQGTA